MSIEPAAGATVRALSPSALAEIREEQSPHAVLDIREPMEYAKGHLLGSTLVPRRAVERRLPELVPDRATDVVLVATTDERGERTAAWLTHLGWQSVAYLQGGVQAWDDAGYETRSATDDIYASAFNVPSKKFGEQVAVTRDPPTVSAERLREWLAADDPVTVVDVRTPGEYQSGTLPTAVNVEGVDLPAYVEQVRDDEPLVVHCAGRTRSLMAAATLAKRGVENVYGLEDGTSGWRLADYELDSNANRRLRVDELTDAPSDEQRTFAEDLLREADVDRLDVGDFADWRAADEGNGYPIDVRTVAEYEAGHIPDSLGIPGGQAIQRADDYIAVSEPDIVCISRTGVRAAVTAYWFAEMGFEDVAVLDGGIDAWVADGRDLETGSRWQESRGLTRAVEHQRSCRPLPAWEYVCELAPRLAPADVTLPETAAAESSGEMQVLHVGRSEAYRDAHLPGSCWMSRNTLDEAVSDAASTTLLTCPDGVVSTYAAAVLHQAEICDVVALAGGIQAWRDAGREIVTGDDGLLAQPPDVVPSTSDQGDEKMRGYLEWERQLGRSAGE